MENIKNPLDAPDYSAGSRQRIETTEQETGNVSEEMDRSVTWEYDLDEENARLREGMDTLVPDATQPVMSNYVGTPITRVSDNGDYGWIRHEDNNVFVHVSALGIGKKGKLTQGNTVYYIPKAIVQGDRGLKLNRGYNARTYAETKARKEQEQSTAAHEASAKKQAYTLLFENGETVWELLGKQLPVETGMRERRQFLQKDGGWLYASLIENNVEITSSDPKNGITAKHMQKLVLEAEVNGQTARIIRKGTSTTSGWDNVTIQQNDLMSHANTYHEEENMLEVTFYVGGQQVSMKYPAIVHTPAIVEMPNSPVHREIVQYITAETPVGQAYSRRELVYGHSTVMGYTFAKDPVGQYDLSALLVEFQRGDLKKLGFDQEMVERIISGDLPVYEHVYDIIRDLTRLRPRGAEDAAGFKLEDSLSRVLLHQGNPDMILEVGNVSQYVPGTQSRVTDDDKWYDPGRYEYLTYISLKSAHNYHYVHHTAPVTGDIIMPGTDQYYDKNGTTTSVFKMTDELIEAVYKYCEDRLAQAGNAEIQDRRELSRLIQQQQQHLFKEFLRLRSEESEKISAEAEQYHGVVFELIKYKKDLSAALSQLNSLSGVDRYSKDIHMGNMLLDELQERLDAVINPSVLPSAYLLEDTLVDLRKYVNGLKQKVSEEVSLPIDVFIQRIRGFESQAEQEGIRCDYTLVRERDKGTSQHQYVVLRADGSIHQPDKTEYAGHKTPPSWHYQVIDSDSVIVAVTRGHGRGQSPYHSFDLELNSHSYSFTDEQIDVIATTFFGTEADLASSESTIFIKLEEVGITSRNELVAMLRKLSEDYRNHQDGSVWGSMKLSVTKEVAETRNKVVMSFRFDHDDPRIDQLSRMAADRQQSTQGSSVSGPSLLATDIGSDQKDLENNVTTVREPSRNDRYLESITKYLPLSNQDLASLVSIELKGDIGMQQIIHAIQIVRAWEQFEVPELTNDQLTRALQRVKKILKDARRDQGDSHAMISAYEKLSSSLEQVVEVSDVLPVLERAYHHEFYIEHLGKLSADDPRHIEYRRMISERIFSYVREHGGTHPDEAIVYEMIEEVVIELI